jgi:hypothetical protein
MMRSNTTFACVSLCAVMALVGNCGFEQPTRQVVGRGSGGTAPPQVVLARAVANGSEILFLGPGHCAASMIDLGVITRRRPGVVREPAWRIEKVRFALDLVTTVDGRAPFRASLPVSPVSSSKTHRVAAQVTLHGTHQTRRVLLSNTIC